MTDAHAVTGLKLLDRDGFALMAIASALAGGTVGDIATMRHLAVRAKEVGVEAALLLALAGLDPEATRIARGETDGVSPAVAHALSLVGLRGVDPHVALAVAPVMDDSSVDGDMGPHAGCSVAWWEDHFTVWTPTTAASRAGVTTDRTILLDCILPDTVTGMMAGRPLRDVVRHPMIVDDLIVESAVVLAGATTLHLRRLGFAPAI